MGRHDTMTQAIMCVCTAAILGGLDHFAKPFALASVALFLIYCIEIVSQEYRGELHE